MRAVVQRQVQLQELQRVRTRDSHAENKTTTTTTTTMEGLQEAYLVLACQLLPLLSSQTPTAAQLLRELPLKSNFSFYCTRSGRTRAVLNQQGDFRSLPPHWNLGRQLRGIQTRSLDQRWQIMLNKWQHEMLKAELDVGSIQTETKYACEQAACCVVS